MAKCPICHEGTLEEQLSEVWMQRGKRWVLVKNVPAIKCDVCGETTFSQKIAERLATVLSADSPYAGTRLVTYPEYDFSNLGKVTPVVMRGTAELTGLPKFVQPKFLPPLVEVKTGAMPV